MVIKTLTEDSPLSDLATDLPQAVRLQRLVAWLRKRFGCGAVVLLRLQEEHLRPVALDGLVGEALGRRFAVFFFFFFFFFFSSLDLSNNV